MSLTIQRKKNLPVLGINYRFKALGAKTPACVWGGGGGGRGKNINKEFFSEHIIAQKLS